MLPLLGLAHTCTHASRQVSSCTMDGTPYLVNNIPKTQAGGIVEATGPSQVGLALRPASMVFLFSYNTTDILLLEVDYTPPSHGEKGSSSLLTSHLPQDPQVPSSRSPILQSSQGYSCLPLHLLVPVSSSSISRLADPGKHKQAQASTASHQKAIITRQSKPERDKRPSILLSIGINTNATTTPSVYTSGRYITLPISAKATGEPIPISIPI